jgi:alanyl-tRNA synthetase
VDINIESLSPDDACRVESMANDIVFKNIPVRYHYPGPDEISRFDLRKAPSVTENIRIVEVDGFDFSPCGGTHPLHTGDVGLIKIRKWEKYKSSVRVEFVCGYRALKDYTWKNDYINQLSNILSSKETDIIENARNSLGQLHEANKEVKALKDKVLSYEALDLYNNSGIVKGVHIIKQSYIDREFKELTYLAGKITRYPSAIALLGVKSSNAQMIFMRSSDLNVKMNDLFKETLPLINGKGGGNPQSAQGGGTDISNLESALDSAYIILKNRYL